MDNFKEIMTDEVTSDLPLCMEKLNFVISDLKLINQELVSKEERILLFQLLTFQFVYF